MYVKTPNYKYNDENITIIMVSMYLRSIHISLLKTQFFPTFFNVFLDFCKKSLKNI